MSKPVVKSSSLYEPLGGGIVRCLVCERKCALKPGVRGVCRNYVNMDGSLVHVGYGRLTAVELRPIEIKPLFHYYPGSLALTYSNFGCNFYCPWCQNDNISFLMDGDRLPTVSPEELVYEALRNGAHGLSASFNEPVTQIDYVVDVTTVARKFNLYSMVVTNMYFTEASLKAAIEAGVDGFSTDIKGCPSIKRALVDVDHNVVFRNAKIALNYGCHVEMVYLVVTNTNDHEECYRWIIGRHVDELGPEVPIHINRYRPAHRWREPPTPIDKLLEIYRYAKEVGLNYVYIGNTRLSEYESTKCPNCGRVVIYRSGFEVVRFNLTFTGGSYRCTHCGAKIPIYGHYCGGG